ncbi:MAG: LysM peptidoglycan-binding domain-containing protein [Holophagales bacterium]|nr:LysM peptidoglycan-binding domain-containing protein [Holophagales bacterium]MYG32117.1 LysM peptidoglycan-binding domain-containing protein [Holophagales bacterium]MYI80827.1 LysM peptidoglycan-binding domain-containing protein [Holophagales bacterium]
MHKSLVFSRIRSSMRKHRCDRPRLSGLLPVCTVLLAFVASGAVGQERYHPAIDPGLFPLPGNLEAAVEFWKDVFATYTSDQVILHDERHLNVVYSVVDMGDLRATGSSELQIDRARIRRVRAEMSRIAKALRDLAAGRPAMDLPPDLRSIPSQMENIAGGRTKYRRAAGLIRSQRGLRDRFEEAIEISGMFMPGIQRTLADYGLPAEIRCLPFVESMFNYRARSKVGASGAWQFTASTGRAFLQMDEAVDARSDVLLAAEGAARKLRQDYESLEAWPLALTAYNHGAGGMARAVRRLDTRDIGVIAEKYRSRTFGFASRNFYPEFLAAVIVYADRDRHFPGIEPFPEIRFDVVDRDRYVALTDLATATGVEMDELAELNPALDRSVLAGSLLVPPRYPLRVPAGSAPRFEQAYAALSPERKPDRQAAFGYRVRRGDTLGAIARRFGSSVSEIQRANRLPRADRIYVGQRLRIPQQGSGRTAPPPVQRAAVRAPAERTAAAETRNSPQETPSEIVHVVRSGESVHRIARKYGVTVATVVAANELGRPELIHAGQRLRIPAGGKDVVYRVRRGDTLSQLARTFGTSTAKIQRANGLRGSRIIVGQTLRIPAG